MKRCPRCEEEKPISDFNRNASRKDGLAYVCRPCASELAKEWRVKHGLPVRGERESREIRNAKALVAYHASRERIAQRRIDEHEHLLNIERASRERNKEKNRARKNERQAVRNRIIQGKRFHVTDKDLHKVLSSPCFSCGSTEKPSIEHIIPLSRSGNHSVGNLLTLCIDCNISKGARFLYEWKHIKHLTFEGM